MEHRTAAALFAVGLLVMAATAAATGAGARADGPARQLGGIAGSGPSAPVAVGGAAEPAGVDAGTTADRGVAPPGESIRDQIETDEIRLVIDVRSDGSAAWAIKYRTALDDENTTAAFESLQTDIRANPENYTERFARRIRETVRSAENATGREMTVREFSVETSVEPGSPLNGYGVITYRFEWTNFARVEAGGDRLVIGDAIEGFFLDSKSLMEVSYPREYERVSVSPEPDSTSATAVAWEGSETNFLSGQPRVVVERSGGTTGPTTTGTGTNAAGGPGGGDGGGGMPVTLVVVAVLAAAIAAVGYRWYARSGGAPAPAPGGSPAGAGADAAATDGTTGETAAAGGAATADESDAEGVEETGDGEDEPEIDEELLSNEERVLRLLEERGGRIKQQEVVDALDWTEAKTSQVVSGMREEGTIEGFRLGRENVLTLPEEDEEPSEDGDSRSFGDSDST